MLLAADSFLSIQISVHVVKVRHDFDVATADDFASVAIFV